MYLAMKLCSCKWLFLVPFPQAELISLMSLLSWSIYLHSMLSIICACRYHRIASIAIVKQDFNPIFKQAKKRLLVWRHTRLVTSRVTRCLLRKWQKIPDTFYLNPVVKHRRDQRVVTCFLGLNFIKISK